jgi:male-specific lethal 1
MNDDVFLKRHAKFEIDEKRRKKWDLMRIREQKTIERLKKRHEGYVAESSSGGENLTTSFYPSPDNVRFIQISEEIPVQAFGDDIPAIPAKEFTLPWSIKQSSVHNASLLVQRTKYICRKNIYPTLVVKRKYGKHDNKK